MEKIEALNNLINPKKFSFENTMKIIHSTNLLMYGIDTEKREKMYLGSQKEKEMADSKYENIGSENGDYFSHEEEN